LYQYGDDVRFVGPWDNPNTFGLLMGTGAVLAMHGAILKAGDLRFNIGKARAWGCAIVILRLAAMGFMVRGLLHSYSRGAWCAAACGIVNLAWRKLQSSNSKIQFEFGSPVSRVLRFKNLVAPFSPSRLFAFRFSIAVILASVIILCFWQLRETEWHLVRRVFSVTKTEDFSWRNRVAAWGGALQITAEHPWFGTGWNQPEPLYEYFYLPQKLTAFEAIEVNDYLMLGATLGVPALFCFGMYVWLTLGQRSEVRGQRSEIGDQKLELTSDRCPLTSDFLSATCHAGAIVLLVGFWFDGGLFKLPTAATFWILLELGAVGQSGKREGGKAETGENETSQSLVTF
jgi:O-antigen ligase